MRAHRRTERDAQVSARQVTKSATDQVIDGVLGGLAEYLGIESVIVRLLYLVLAIANPAIGVLAYIAMAVIMPGPGGRISAVVGRTGTQDAGSSDRADDPQEARWDDPGTGGAAHDAEYDSGPDRDEAADGASVDSDYSRPDRVRIIGAGLVALGVFLVVERLVPMPDLSSFAWAVAIGAIGVWILLRGRRDR